MPNCRQLNQSADLPELFSWFAARGLEHPPLWTFSNEGYIVPSVAAGFLYLTNSGIAQLDFYVTNPEATPRDRYLAVCSITERLIWSAKWEHDVKMLCCNSKHRSIRTIAQKFGFVGSESSYTNFYKHL